MKKKVMSRRPQVKTSKAKRRRSMINAANTWKRVKNKLGDDVLVVQCLAPFFPKRCKGLQRFIDILLKETHSKWPIKTAGTLLVRRPPGQIVAVLNNMVAQNRRPEDILSLVHSVLESRECDSGPARALWRFFVEYLTNLPGSAITGCAFSILEIFRSFYNNGIVFEDVARQFCDLLPRFTKVCRPFIAQRFIECFASSISLQRQSNAVAEIDRLLDPYHRALFLISSSKYIPSYQAIGLLKQALTKILSNPAYGNLYNIETILLCMSEQIKNTAYWTELASLVLDSISKLDTPTKRLQYLSKIAPFLPRRVEGRVCEVVESAVRDPSYSQQESKQDVKGSNNGQENGTDKND